MKRFDFKDPQFITSAVAPKDYPSICDKSGNPLVEIAFAGRSNVGKSSLINHLVKQNGFAKTSSTPGKTQLLNFFTVANSLAVVDLPGYGYAQVPKAVQKNWGKMVQTYLETRSSLLLILLLFDIRRVPNEDDKLMMEWIAHHNKAVILVLTKVDKVNKSELVANTKKILAAFDCENLHYVHYSVTKNVGRKELLNKIYDALRNEMEAAAEDEEEE